MGFRRWLWAGEGQATGKGHSSLGQGGADGGRSQGEAQSRRSQVGNQRPARIATLSRGRGGRGAQDEDREPQN